MKVSSCSFAWSWKEISDFLEDGEEGSFRCKAEDLKEFDVSALRQKGIVRERKRERERKIVERFVGWSVFCGGNGV